MLLGAIFLISSCEENPATIGAGLLPGKDFVNIRSTDTIGVSAYNRYVDSIISNNRTYSYLGGLYDPYFGNTYTDFVGQLRLLNQWPGDGSFVVDSVKLFFTIVGAKGTLGSNQRIKLYEITETLYSDTIYYSNRDVNKGMEIGTFDLPVINKDTVAEMSINLPKSFGEYLTRDTTRLIQGDEVNDFRSFFKGLYVSLADSPDPMLMAFTFSLGEFYIRVYYSTGNTSNLIYDFVINAKSVRYNRYFHVFTTATSENRIKHINDGIKDTLIYLQGFDGVFPSLTLNGLESYRDSLPVSVNKARLIIPAFLDDDIYTTSTIPSKIFISYNASDGQKIILPECLVSPVFFDGTFNSTTKKYTFNIAAFVQEYLEGRIPEPEVELCFSDTEYRNVILKANNNPAPVKFEFTYTKF